MKITPALEQGILQRRYKRFFVDVTQQDGSTLTIHCPNTGSMKNCLVPGSACWFSRSDDPKRKLKGTLEIVTSSGGHQVGINTGRPNKLVEEAIENGVIQELQGYQRLRREVRYGEERSRIDLLLEGETGQCYVEVKNVTLEDDHNPSMLKFPDAVTSRGTKHLRELTAMAEQGHRAVLVFCVQHDAAEQVSIAAEIDPGYAETLRQAMTQGVELLAYGCHLSSDEISIQHKLPFILR